MKKFLLVPLSAAVLFGQSSLIIPHVADGGSWQSTVAIFNSFSIDPARVSIIFRGDDGGLLTLPIKNVGAISSLELDLAPQGAVFLETSATNSSVQTGWVEVVQLTGNTPVRGYAVFRQRISGRPDFEAVSMGLRSADSLTFPFDNTAGLVTSFAVVNVTPVACGLSVSAIFDEFGNSLTAGPKLIGNLTARGHVAFVSTDKMPELANKRGFLTVNADPLLGCSGLAALGLRFNPSGPFTNLLPLRMGAF